MRNTFKSIRKADWLGITSASGYLDDLYPRERLTHFTDAEFCGYMLKVPKDFDRYLTADYDDCLQIPPPEKREIHSAYKIEFSK